MNEKIIKNKIKAIDNQLMAYDLKVHRYRKSINPRVSNLLKDLKIKRLKLENELEEMKTTSKNIFEDIKIGVQMACLDLNLAYDSIVERVKKEKS